MIEAKHILSLCDRFQQYLIPLDIHVLRQRYNGKTYKSTYAVAREMHISDETVRTIENRALDAIAHCLDLEDAGQAITPMRLAKSFRQPAASLICQGQWRSASAAAYTAHRGELLIFASSVPMELREFEMHLHEKRYETEHMTAYPRGAIVGRVLLIDCFRLPIPMPHPHKWMLRFNRQEVFPEPIPYSGEPSFFHINNEVAKRLPTRYAYSFNGDER